MSLPASTILLVDDDREHTSRLAASLAELGHGVTMVRSFAAAFRTLCIEDFDALVAAPTLRDGTALALPSALGFRRPRLAVLVSRMTDRIAEAAARRVGFDRQLTKVVDPRILDRILRHAKAPGLPASSGSVSRIPAAATYESRLVVPPSELG